jgi:pimeloyl-ACP methyl ester carboxylesterase
MSAASQPSHRGRMIDIGGRSLHTVCAGPKTDSPTVIFESGAFGFSADWAAVQGRLAEEGVRSCAYDRAGLGRSDPGPKPRDGLAVVSDFEALLARAGEPGPYILVGHSMAGLYVRLYAARNPGQVKGVVLVDAATAEASEHPLVRRWVDGFASASQWAGRAASVGLFKPLGPAMGDRIGLPAEAAAEKRRAFASGVHNRWAAEEVGQWVHAAKQASEAGAYDPEWPLAVVTAGPPRGRMAQWKEMQAGPAKASRHGYVRNVEAAGHATLLGLDHAEEIAKAVLFVRGKAA